MGGINKGLLKLCGKTFVEILIDEFSSLGRVYIVGKKKEFLDFGAEVYDDLIEVGVDAVNSQLFCMDMADLEKRAKGKITFWGEIDRQHVLPDPDPQAARDAVRKVAQYLYDPSGGMIAQFEFGPGANPECALAIFDEWAKVEAENR